MNYPWAATRAAPTFSAIVQKDKSKYIYGKIHLSE